jgi:AraC family transcriptional regulator
MSTPALALNTFFGSHARMIQAGDFSLKLLRPTVRREEMVVHSHADPHFVLVLSGAYESLAFRSEIISQGLSLIYNPAGTEHRDCFVEPEGQFMTVTLPSLRMAELFGVRTARDPIHCTTPVLVKTALSLCRAVIERDDFTAESLAMEMVCGVACLPESAAGPRHRPQWIGQACELINDRWHEALGLRDIAAELGVHPVHLTRAFRQHTGRTPGAYHRGVRLNRAIDRLMRGGASAADVALTAGYADQAHFVRSVSAAYGLAPGRLLSLLRNCADVCSVQDIGSRCPA